MSKSAASGTLFLTLLVLLALDPNLRRRVRAPFFYGLLLFLALTLPWHLFMYHRFGEVFVKQYLGLHVLGRVAYQFDGHLTPWWYYLRVLLFSAPPWVLLYPAALYAAFRNRTLRPFAVFALVQILFFLLCPDPPPPLHGPGLRPPLRPRRHLAGHPSPRLSPISQRSAQRAAAAHTSIPPLPRAPPPSGSSSPSDPPSSGLSPPSSPPIPAAASIPPPSPTARSPPTIAKRPPSSSKSSAIPPRSSPTPPAPCSTSAPAPTTPSPRSSSTPTAPSSKSPSNPSPPTPPPTSTSQPLPLPQAVTPDPRLSSSPLPEPPTPRDLHLPDHGLLPHPRQSALSPATPDPRNPADIIDPNPFPGKLT